MRLSLVTMSHPREATCGIHMSSLVAGSAIGHADRSRRLMTAPGSPGYVASLRRPATTLGQAEEVSVEVEADDRRLGAAHATCCLACARRGFSYARAQATSRGVRP